MKNDIAKIFRLQAFKIYGSVVTEKEVILRVALKKSHVRCPFCGRLKQGCYEKGKVRRVKHQYWGKKVVILEGRKSRWWCKHCQRSFTEIWPGVKKWSRKSEEAEFQILDLLKGKSFRRLQEENGISDHEARYLLSKVDTAPTWHEEKDKKAIRLGIDEHSFRGRNLVITVTNLSQRRLKSVLPDDRQASLRAWIRAIPVRIKPRIEEVCIDLKESFLAVLEQELPKADVVADHFHVIQDANRRLDENRRLEQEMQKRRWIGKRWWFLMGRERLDDKHRKLLDALLDKYPTLKEFYWHKERLRDFYRSKNKDEATTALSRIILNMECSDDAAVNQWGRTLKRWRKYILNYFSHRTTNAYTEGANNKIKMIKRMSFGFRNVQIYIRKMLLAFVPVALLWGLNYPTVC